MNNGMTISEMSRAWNVSESKLNGFFKGITVRDDQPTIIPWDDVKEARKTFYLHRPNDVNLD